MNRLKNIKLIHFDEPNHSIKNSMKKSDFLVKSNPEVVLIEYPLETQKFFDKLSKKSPLEKSKIEMNKFKRSLMQNSKECPWLKGDFLVFEEIEKFWEKGKQVYVFAIDAPVELTNIGQIKGILNVVWNYLRELYMAKIIKKLCKKFNNSKILIFCHNYHWNNLQFLLENPNKEQIFNYYFKNCGVDFIREVVEELKKNKILLKYWFQNNLLR